MMPPERGPAVYALTPRGAQLGRLLARGLQGSLHLPRRLAEAAQEADAAVFDSLPVHVAALFHRRPAHVFITAAGVAVRMIAPHLRGKDQDPAVLVLDQEGRFCVSLLSGHLGGANRLAQQAARLAGGRAVVTTATDTAGAPAVDVLAREAGLVIADLRRVRDVNAALAAGEQVGVWDPEGWLQTAGQPQLYQAETRDEARVAVDWREPARPYPQQLLLHPPCLCLGVGCRRGVSGSVLEARVRDLFSEQGLALQSLRVMGSVQAKRGEPGLQRLADSLDVPLLFFPAPLLNAVRTPNPSPRVARAVGASSVCEAAALLLAGAGRLLVEKRRLTDITLALAVRRPA